MNQDTIIIELEERAKLAGVSIAKVCDMAGVARSTFSRWKRSKKNPKPIGATIGSLSKLEKVLVSLEQGRAA